MIYRQKTSKSLKHIFKNILSSFCIVHLLLGMGPTPKCGLYAQGESLEDTSFFSFGEWLLV